MSKTELLRALKAELQFLGQGGYGQAFRSPWRPTILLRDSLLCPNAVSAPAFHPCSECKLLSLVPLEKRNIPNPCHHIPLNAAGETLAGLYETGTQEQADRAYREWLCATIEKLEREADMNVIETCTNVSFKNILFLTDLTEASQAAYTYALALARQYHARIYPAHAISSRVPAQFERNTTEISRQRQNNAREQLTGLVKNAGIGYLTLVTEEALEEAVPRWIRELNIDLIVMGTHGRRGLERFLLGSTAEIIFRTATCPVLTVGPHVVPRTEKELQFSKILFATDLTRSSESAITFAYSCALDRLAHLTLMHVLPEGTHRQPDGHHIREFALTELKQLLPEVMELWHEPQFMVEEGDAAEHIVNYAADEHIDLIVLGLPQDKRFTNHFHTGVTYRVVSSAPSAVLTIRDLAGPLVEEQDCDVLKLGGL